MKIEIRSDSEVFVSGYVNAVERCSKLLAKEKGRDAPGPFREKIEAGVFAESLSRIPNVKLTFDHGRDIGVTGDNLTLREDGIGLHAEALISDEQAVEAAKSGRLTGWSFGFTNAYGDYIPAGDGTYERDIKGLDLLEVALLTKRPAYTATSVEVRDDEVLELRESDDLTEDMQLINKFSRSELKPEDVYTFPIALCNNEIDRDIERFSIPALNKLAELFVGKTGIFDHDPKGENQTARIYKTWISTDESRITSTGEPFTELMAKAYMLRLDKTADLIKEIDGGIKKEVSIACSVGKKFCSVCGSEECGCEHRKGKSYDGTICCAVLDEPLDAYEWSFVAVPAQTGAGVKKCSEADNQKAKELSKNAAWQREIEILKMKGKIYDEH